MSRAEHDYGSVTLAALAFALGYFIGRSGAEPAEQLLQKVNPQGIPAAGPPQLRRSASWQDIVFEVYRRADEDRLLAVPGGVGFFGLLALFPSITALVSCYALLADPRTIAEHVALLAGFAPAGAIDIIRDQLLRVAAIRDATLGTTFIFSLLLALWSAHGGIKATMDALNAVNGGRQTRSALRLNAT